MPSSKAQLEAIARYRKKYEKTYLLTLHNERDIDIIEQMEKQESKNGYLKQLIRADIKKEE